MPTSRPIVSRGATLAARIKGAGDPVIFLHAAVADSRMWQEQLIDISPRYLAVAYDRRGYGGTKADQSDYSAVDDVIAVMDDVAGGKPVTLAGCSHGGRLALEVALRHPTRVSALFLVAPSVSGAPLPEYPPEIAPLIDRLRKAEANGDLDLVSMIKAHLWLDGPLSPEGRVGGLARMQFIEMNSLSSQHLPVGTDTDVTPVYDRLHEIAVPTLILQGDLDFPHILERSRHLAETMPNATLEVLRGTAHLPTLDQPAAVTGSLLAFLDGQSHHTE